MGLADDAVEHLLATWPVARLATLGPSGPRQVPIVFVRSERDLWTPVDGKPKSTRELARVRDVQRDPRVSVLLDDYADDWSRLWWIRVDGDARVVRPADPHRDSQVAAALEALRAKYPQYRVTPILRDPPTLLRVSVRSIRSWGGDPSPSWPRPSWGSAR